MYLEAKKRAVGRPASSDCVKVTIKREGSIARVLYNTFPYAVKWAIIVILIFCTILTITSVYAARNPELEEVNHRVAYGDTLWGIAKEYKPDGMTMGDYMNWIYERNGDGMIYPGDIVVMGVKK